MVGAGVGDGEGEAVVGRPIVEVGPRHECAEPLTTLVQAKVVPSVVHVTGDVVGVMVEEGAVIVALSLPRLNGNCDSQ